MIKLNLMEYYQLQNNDLDNHAMYEFDIYKNFFLNVIFGLFSMRKIFIIFVRFNFSLLLVRWWWIAAVSFGVG